MDKSHVGMEAARCPVCDKEFETGAILLDRRLRNSLERLTVTHMALCPAHRAREGYVLLVGVDPARSNNETVWRTGMVAELRTEVWPRVFNLPLPTSGFSFCDEAILLRLQEESQKAGGAK